MVDVTYTSTYTRSQQKFITAAAVRTFLKCVEGTLSPSLASRTVSLSTGNITWQLSNLPRFCPSDCPPTRVRTASHPIRSPLPLQLVQWLHPATISSPRLLLSQEMFSEPIKLLLAHF